MHMPTMRIDRLGELLRVAESIPPRRLRMKSWFDFRKRKLKTVSEAIRKRFLADKDGIFDGIKGKKVVDVIDASCGTTACLAGYAGMDPWFIKRGFALRVTHAADLRAFVSVDITPTYRGREGFYALMSFFGLTREEVSHLFGGHICSSRKEVIRRIKDVMSGEVRERLHGTREGIPA